MASRLITTMHPEALHSQGFLLAVKAGPAYCQSSVSVSRWRAADLSPHRSVPPQTTLTELTRTYMNVRHHRKQNNDANISAGAHTIQLTVIT
ncbi:hypothetical protein PsyrCH409_06010 [Pseudomonas viridiflava]|nr:hypothetical protein PsyrCH409_06010 [Pseudomonas viridiflava]